MASTRPACDVVIVGAGHNGLTCACYLAAAGLEVRIVERRGVVGGAAVTEEFHPGFRNSTASYTVSLLHPRVIRDLRLKEHGLTIVERPFGNFLPLDGGESIKVGGSLEATQREVARFSAADAGRLPAYYAMLDRVAAVLKDLLLETPPNVAPGLKNLFAAWKSGRRLSALAPPARREVLDLFTMSAGDLLDRWFESVPIKACFGFDSVVGNFASPYSGGSAYVLLHHVFGEVNGKPGIWGHALGGMGAITQAMAREAESRGVRIDVGCARGAGAHRRLGQGVRRGARGRHRDRRACRGRQRQSAIAVRQASRRCRGAVARSRRAFRELRLRVGDLAHERRAVRSFPISPASRAKGRT